MPEPESGQQVERSDCRSVGDLSGPGSRISRWPQSSVVPGVMQYASPVLHGRINEVEMVDPGLTELNGTLTNRFGGNAFFICLFLSSPYSFIALI